MLNLDADVIEQIKSKGWNISAEVNSFLKQKLGERTVNVSGPKCEFCGRKQETETPEEARAHPEPYKLCWICPDEKWICSYCLALKIKKG